jgi:hypothetical protein
MQKAKLASIASIQTGYTFRRGVPVSADGAFSAIQMKNLKEDGSVDLGTLCRVPDEGFREAHRVQAGDLIFRSRGTQFTLGCVPDSSLSLVLAAPLVRVRVDSTKALPGYVAWFVNGPLGRAYFETVMAGSAIKMVSKAAFGEMELPLPPLSEQQTIVEFISLCARERELSETLLLRRTQLLNAKFQDFLT